MYGQHKSYTKITNVAGHSKLTDTPIQFEKKCIVNICKLVCFEQRRVNEIMNPIQETMRCALTAKS